MKVIVATIVATVLLAVCVATTHASPSHTDVSVDASLGVGGQLPNPQKIKVISFDFYAALMDTAKTLSSECSSILVRAGVSSSTAKQVGNSWISKYSTLKDLNGYLRMPGVKVETDSVFQLMVRSTLEETLSEQRVNVNVDTFDALVGIWSNLKPLRDTLEALNKLRSMKNIDGSSRFRLGVLSNGDFNSIAASSTVFHPFTFDFILGSDGAGVFKPEPELYEQILQHYPDVTKEEVLHVAGAGFDAIGAKIFGYQVGWHNYNKVKLFNPTRNDDYQPDLTFADWSELFQNLL
eukprot:GFYU01001892.1.p1 GENE.GFYU01001892.1~~GFYU01001892.1.p1  ORF type:complete len:293 (+),score=73.21 GFYU01001892.1:39-917(+)